MRLATLGRLGDTLRRRVGRGPARIGQASVFGVIAICFALPFADVSCASDELADGLADNFALRRIDRNSFSGWELVAGTAPLVPKSIDPSAAPALGLDREELHRFRVPPEPFAQIAFVAVLVGLIGVGVRRPASRELVASIAGAIAVVSLGLLVTSPSLKKIGLLDVQPKIGYWAALSLSVAAALWHYLLWQASRFGEP